MLKYVGNIQFDQSDDKELVSLYSKMIEKLQDRLNPNKYALITISCSRSFDSKFLSPILTLKIGIEESITFLEEAQVRMKRYEHAVFLLRIAVAERQLSLGKHHDCIEALNEIRATVERHGEADTKVY